MRLNGSPVDYRLCNQTVTVYHREGDTVTTTVYNNAFFDMRKSQTVDEQGTREANAFLLVIPGATQAVFVGDKVLLGEGAEISPGQWAGFIPAAVENLAIVSHAGVKYWQGKAVHTEAGGSQLRFTNLLRN